MKTKLFFMALIAILTAGLKLAAQTAARNTATVQAVTFKNTNLKMAGNLYLPAGFDKAKKYPAIVVVHPGGGVKEQTAGLYAQKQSEASFITLAFDASYQGASEGEPRF